MKSVLIVFLGVIAVSWGYPAVAGVSDIADLDRIRVLEGEDAVSVINDELDPESENIFGSFEDDENENDKGSLVRFERSIESDSDSDSSEDSSDEDSSDEDFNSSEKAKSRTDGRRRNMGENDSASPSDDSDSSDSSDSSNSSESNKHDVDRPPTDDGNAIVVMQLNNEVEAIGGSTEAPQIDRRSQPEIRRKRMAWNVMRSSKESDEGIRSAPRMRWMWDDQKSDVESPNRDAPDLIDAVYEQGIEGQAYPRIPSLNFPREPCGSKFERRDRHGICRPSFMM